MEANRHLLDKVIVTHWPLGAYWRWLASQILFVILVYGLLFWYASPGLRLEGGKMPKFLLSLGRRLGWSGMACLIVVSLGTSPVMAF